MTNGPSAFRRSSIRYTYTKARFERRRFSVTVQPKRELRDCFRSCFFALKRLTFHSERAKPFEGLSARASAHAIGPVVDLIIGNVQSGQSSLYSLAPSVSELILKGIYWMSSAVACGADSLFPCTLIT